MERETQLRGTCIHLFMTPCWLCVCSTETLRTMRQPALHASWIWWQALAANLGWTLSL